LFLEDRGRDAEAVVRLAGRWEPAKSLQFGDSELSASGSFLVGQQDAFAALKRLKMKVAEQDSPFGARLLIHDRSWLGDLIAAVDHA